MDVNASTLVINQAISVKAPDDALNIVMDTALPVGTHVFQLVVVDESGNQSAPAIWRVVVQDTTLPTAMISGPATVEFGGPIILSGKGSKDVAPGTVVTYIWTKLAQ